MQTGLSFRWLGVQGVEFKYAGRTLLVDPFVTRPPVWKFFSPVAADEALGARRVGRADWILVSHAHYDHLLDVPAIARRTGAQVFGSPNVGAILGLHGAAGRQFQRLQVGQRLELGPFSVEVLPSQHIHLPFEGLISGPLRPGLRLPLRPADYRMDENFGFFMEVGGVQILFCPGPPRPCDLLFASTPRTPAMLRPVFAAGQAELFVPLHWENFFRPAEQPPLEIVLPGRFSLARLERLLAAVSPRSRMHVPEMFTEVHWG
jgi:L-ascorbate metabolism protein UlaG (beta-lactamase superfamily)